MKKYFKKLSILAVCAALVISMPVSVLAVGDLAESQLTEAPGVWDEDANHSDEDNYFSPIDPSNPDVLQSSNTYVYLAVSELKIIDQTADCVIDEDSDKQIGISVKGVSPVHTVWEVSTDDGATWTQVAEGDGADSFLYDITDAQKNTPGTVPYQYKATVTDDYGHEDSTIIKVLVQDDYSYRHIKLRDNPDVEVEGFIHDKTRLAVTQIPDDTARYDEMSTHLNPGTVPLFAYNATLYNHNDDIIPYFGKVKVQFNVPADYEGMTLRVIHRKNDGTYEYLESTVTDGKLFIDVDEASDFMVEVPDPNTCTITSTAGENGTISPIGTINMKKGTDKEYIILPDPGYKIDKVVVDGVEVPVDGNFYQFDDVQDNHTIDVTFKEAEKSNQPLSVTAAADGNGEVVVDGTGKVKKGSAQTFYFYPKAGYEIDKITINGKEYKALGHSLTVSSVEENLYLYVTYKPTDKTVQRPDITNTITATSGAHGKISPAGTADVEYGGDMFYYFIPDVGYQIDKVYVDGVETPITNRSYHFVNVVGPHTINVTFKKGAAPDTEYYDVTARVKGRHGTVGPKLTTVVEGGSCTVYFTPDDGYAVNRVWVNGEYVGRWLTAYTVTNIWEDTEIVVDFFKVDGARTADDTNLVGWWAAFGGAAAATTACGAMFVISKRRDDEDEEQPDAE